MRRPMQDETPQSVSVQHCEDIGLLWVDVAWVRCDLLLQPVGRS